TFTTLVTFGGAFFASFPLFYSTSFGGAYWVWALILFSFIIQAVSYEYRSKPANFLGAKTYEIFLILNGALGTILIGTAVGTFFNGAMFSLNDMNQVNWATSTRGLEAVLTFHNVALGLSVFFLSRVLGALYFMNSVDSQAIFDRSKKQIIYNTIPFLVFFLYFLIRLVTKQGFAVDANGVVSMEGFKYLHNLIQMPLVLIILLLGVIGVLYGIFISIFKNSGKGIWFSGSGTVFAVLALFFLAGFNGTAFYPSIYDLQSSLTIQNASSSHFTLTAMSYVSLGVPFVLAYIWWVWKVMNTKKIDEAEMLEEDSHAY
ncbi:MAG TPA: cytochrome d ubiquinol oxidase subunit II, partial [Sunxiuqinia sp.]|nr:cytochrome d ubiquinol oxidase subunit II [Sunxiuqinia sp.]